MNEFKLVPMEPTEAMIDAARDQHEGEPYLPASLYKAMLAAAPAVQGEPVGWQFYQDGKWWYGDDRIKDHRKNTEEAGVRVRNVYAEPQLVEQRPAPDVEALVEALTMARETIAFALRTNAPDYFTTDADIARHVVIQRIDTALSAHRKGGDV